MDHLLACDCFTHEPWIASPTLQSDFSALLLYPKAGTKQNLCSRLAADGLVDAVVIGSVSLRSVCPGQ